MTHVPGRRIGIVQEDAVSAGTHKKWDGRIIGFEQVVGSGFMIAGSSAANIESKLFSKLIDEIHPFAKSEEMFAGLKLFVARWRIMDVTHRISGRIILINQLPFRSIKCQANRVGCDFCSECSGFHLQNSIFFIECEGRFVPLVAGYHQWFAGFQAVSSDHSNPEHGWSTNFELIMV